MRSFSCGNKSPAKHERYKGCCLMSVMVVQMTLAVDYDS